MHALAGASPISAFALVAALAGAVSTPVDAAGDSGPRLEAPAAPQPERGRATDFTSARTLIELRKSYGDDVDLAGYAAVNVIVPGSGMLLDGETSRGLVYAGLGASLLAGALIANAQPRGESFRNNCLILYQNLGFLAAWDGYYRGLGQRSERAAEALGQRPSLKFYILSSFDRESLSSWEWGLPTGVAAALGAADVTADSDARPPGVGSTLGVESLILVQSMLVGAGEELLFRGVVLPELAVRLGSDRKALATQALAFGLAHVTPDATAEENAIHVGFATAFGLYAGWVALDRPHGLRKAIAMHAWWDALVFSADYLRDGRVDPIVVRVRF